MVQHLQLRATHGRGCSEPPGRNILSGPGLFALNLSLFKNFKVRERANVELRCETFNFTNTPQFANPQGSAHEFDFRLRDRHARQRHGSERYRRRKGRAVGREGFVLTRIDGQAIAVCGLSTPRGQQIARSKNEPANKPSA